MTRADQHRRLPINTRRTLFGDGRVAEDSFVACPSHGHEMVAMERCAACGQGGGLVFDGRPGSSYLICRQVPTPREAAERRVAASQSGSASRSGGVEPARDVKRVAEVMSRDVVCVRADLGVACVRELLLSRGFSGAPVVDEGGRPIGVVSKTDLLRERFEAAAGGAADGTGARCAGDVMTPIAMTLVETAPIYEAAALMARHGVHRVPIVTHDGRLVGVVSSLDMLRWIAWENGYLVPAPGSRL